MIRLEKNLVEIREEVFETSLLTTCQAHLALDLLADDYALFTLSMNETSLP